MVECVAIVLGQCDNARFRNVLNGVTQTNERGPLYIFCEQSIKGLLDTRGLSKVSKITRVLCKCMRMQEKIIVRWHVVFRPKNQ